MARCSCAGGICACVIIAGAGADITGTGTPQTPYVVSLTGGVVGSVQVQDTATLDLHGTGAGTPTDPLVITGDVTMTMQQLSNVPDANPGSIGMVPTWNGATWIYATPAAAPAGSVATWQSMDGDGSAPNPLRLATGTGVDWTAAGYSGTPESAGSRLFQTNSTVAEVHGPPEHTSKQSNVVTVVNGAVAAAASPALSAITAPSSVSITNNTARQMAWFFHGTGGSIFSWVGAGGSTADALFSLVEDGGAELTNQRLARWQAQGNGGAGYALQGAIRTEAGVIAQGATKSFAIGIRYQRVNGADACTFSFHATSASLIGVTI